jgi:hypothetical protein
VRRRRRRGERRNFQFANKIHTTLTQGVMVWVALSYGSRSPLVFVEQSLNASHLHSKHIRASISTVSKWLTEPHVSTR